MRTIFRIAVWTAMGLGLPLAVRASTDDYARSEFAKWSTNLVGAANLDVSFVCSDAYGEDGFRLFRRGGGPITVTGGKRGVIYGAYELLERFGGIVFCTSWYTYVPKDARLSVPADLDIVERPSFERREAGWYDAFFHHPDFAVRLRLNGNRAHIPESMGGMPWRYGKGYMSHTFEKLLPVGKYAKDHPDWFAEIEGVRRTANTQPCLTNPEVLETVTSNLFAAIEANPDANLFAVSQYDNVNYCRCANCRAVDEAEGATSGTMMRFVNAVAERVERRWPKLVIQYPAYQYTQEPPKLTKPRGNVLVDLAAIESDFALPMAESQAARSRKMRELVAAWGKLTKWFYVWYYTTNYRYCMHPMPTVRNIAADTRFFRDSGVTQLHMQGCWTHAAFAELKQWIIAKTSWNADADVEALIDTFCRAYYGEAAPLVKEIIADEEHAIRSRPKPMLSIFAFDEPHKFSDELLARTLQRWREAEAAVKDDDWRLHHVRMGELATVATIMDRAADRAKWVWATENPEAAEAPRSDFADLYAWMTAAREESRRSVDELHFSELPAREKWYLEKWERALRFARPAKGSPTGVAQADDFSIQQGANNHVYGEKVRDAETASGHALKVNTDRNGPVAKLSFANVAFDRGAKYRLRVRVKVEKAEDATRGEAFYASLSRDYKPVLEAFADVADVGTGYAWYDLGTCRLSDDMEFGFGCGRYARGGGRLAVTSVSLDCLELRKERTGILSPGNGETVSLLTEPQRHYLSLPRTERARYFADKDSEKPMAYRKYGTLPAPVVLTWAAEPDAQEVVVEVVRKPDGRRFFRKTVCGTNAVEVWNLEVARTWEWTVTSPSGTKRAQFRTADEAPRMLKLDNIKNCRDLGGRRGYGGRRVRQGMLFRTQGMNANAKFKKEPGELGKIIEPPTKRGEDRLTPETKRYMTEDLGIRTDIDLRTENETFGMDGSPLGPSVRFENHSLIGAYGLMKGEYPRKTMKELFALLLKRETYPAVIHCIGGADRTGCVAFALNALLGVDEDELFKDYEVTAMGNSFRKGGLGDQKHWNGFNRMVDGFRQYPGTTLCEQAENAFKSLGFTDADIRCFREIMLEDETLRSE